MKVEVYDPQHPRKVLIVSASKVGIKAPADGTIMLRAEMNGTISPIEILLDNGQTLNARRLTHINEATYRVKAFTRNGSKGPVVVKSHMRHKRLGAK